MPVTDPLLKSLKYLIEEFHSMGEPVTDSSPYLAPFCQTMEHALTQGIKLGPWDFLKEDGQSMKRKRFWTMLVHFQTSGPIPLSLSSTINMTQQNIRLRFGDGKLRFAIRSCLMRKSIHVLLEFLMSRRHDLEETWYHGKQELQMMSNTARKEIENKGLPIITEEPLAEQFRSLLLTVSTSLTFELCMDNSYFLDQTWNIPDMRTVEFVPTEELGLALIYIDGYGVVTRTKAGSPAADAPEIGLGDLLVSMNGKPLFPAKYNGENDVMDAWKKCKRKGRPCQLTVIKPRCPGTGGVFNPMRSVLSRYQDYMETYYDKKQKRLEKEMRAAEEKGAKSIAPSSFAKGRAPVADGREGCGCYQVRYVGEIVVGEHGGMGQIEGVIKTAMQRRSAFTIMNVVVEITEIAVLTRKCNERIIKKMCRQCRDGKMCEQCEKEEQELKDIQSLTKKNNNHVINKTCNKNGLSSDEDLAPIATSSSDNDVIFSHKFADISSCGKIVTDEKHFCYIAGDTFCTISKQFKGYVFEARSMSQARLVLNNIYQGFKRTTWFM